MNVRDFYQPRHLTSSFGDGRGGGRKHRGVDFSHSTTPCKIAIPAILAGTVVDKLAPASWHGFGHQVTIESNYGGRTIRFSYAHLCNASPLKIGQKVASGTVVGHEGRTGSTTGNCVHIELNNGSGFINPAPTIEAIRANSSSASKPSGYSKVTADVQNAMNVWYNAGLVVDGINGPKTKAAILNAQKNLKAEGLYKGPLDGVWGPLTNSALNAHRDRLAAAKPKPATGSSLIRKVQQKLKSNYPLYASKLVVDGIQGPATTAAIKEFQRRSGLVVDGIVGPRTRKALGV